MGSCWELLKGVSSKCVEKHHQMDCGQAAGHCARHFGSSATGWRRSRAAQKSHMFTAASAGKQCGRGKEGKELGGIGNLKGSLGAAREPVWEECIYAAGLLLDMDSVESQRMLVGLVGDVSLTWAVGKRQGGLAGSKHPRVNIPWKSNSVGRKRNHRKKLLKYGEVCECGLGRAEASSQGSRVSSNLSGPSNCPGAALRAELGSWSCCMKHGQGRATARRI